ncbi:exodeoxyribonuclease-like isoform X2 [Corticium candelabrum]|uniref:exodeoxyribonuclease-like isoform X2 n=1 Tax=Corticium candelabrum TaxID=121492 RepID=UPI002E255ED0|nr:exodeoxyribonuclease-like isoform X2 [Corticium candelabrum]
MPPRKKKGSPADAAEPDEKESADELEPKRKIRKTKEKKVTSDSASEDAAASIGDLSNDSKTADGRPWKLKFMSWNVNGLKAWSKRGYTVDYIKREDPDICCLQETKCDKDNIPEEAKLEGYHTFWLSGERKGYSGTGLYSKVKPMNVTYGMGVEEHDKEGRLITAEYETFYFVGSYVPNAGRGLPRLGYRQTWDTALQNYLVELDKKKPVVFCGDLNVAHKEIDIANPKSNKKSAGFTMEEREGFSDLLSCGFVDSFRCLYPDKKGAYTFWVATSRTARADNVGWRLDYFVISQRLESDLCDNVIRSSVKGSDHCPIVLFLAT